MNKFSVSLNQAVTVAFYHHGNITNLKSGVVIKITPTKKDITVEFKDGNTSKFNSNGVTHFGGTWSTSRAEIVNVNDEKQLNKVNEFKDSIKRNKLIKSITEKLPNLQTADLEYILTKVEELV